MGAMQSSSDNSLAQAMIDMVGAAVTNNPNEIRGRSEGLRYAISQADDETFERVVGAHSNLPLDEIVKGVLSFGDAVKKAGALIGRLRGL